jgi:hypothetical protein
MVNFPLNPFQAVILAVDEVDAFPDESYDFLHVLENAVRSLGETLAEIA